MRTFTLKRLFFAAVFIAFSYLTVHAAGDDGLITRQITIKLDQAGTLPERISDIRKSEITNLKIIGEINGTDFRFIREMAGRNLATLNLSETKIVKGGDYYYKSYYTSNDAIGASAFEGCSGLTSLTLPSGVTSIGASAFYGCSGLTSLTLPSSVTSIGEYAFFYLSGLTNLTLPSGITSIGASAFEGCSGLTSLTLPPSLTSIGKSAFYGCSGLTSLTLPSSVTSIGASAFGGCSGLTSLTLSSSVTSIGESAFYGCSGLTSLILPPSVTSIGRYAFEDCRGLTSVYVSWKSPLSIDTSIFDDVNTEKCILYVPKGTYDDYWLSSNWGVFENIVEYDATGIKQVTTSGDAKEISRYSVNGQRLDAPAKGLNIVKYSDGSVKKVIVQ